MSKLTVVAMVLVGLCFMIENVENASVVAKRPNLSVTIKNLSEDTAHCSVDEVKVEEKDHKYVDIFKKEKQGHSIFRNPEGDSHVVCFYHDKDEKTKLMSEEILVSSKGKYCFTIKNNDGKSTLQNC